MSKPVKYPGIRITTNGNQLVASYTESLIAEAGVFYPITPSTEMGENFQMCYAQGQLNAYGKSLLAIETEGEHAAQGGAIAISLTGRRVVNFTSGQGIVYGLEQYYGAPGKLSTMVLEVGARALTRHALNVHCGHDDIYAALQAGWIMLFAKDAQQASDQSIILRRVTELSLTPGMNIQDGFLTTHLERTFVRPEPELIREYLGFPDDQIDCPTKAQKELFGDKRRRVPKMIDLENPTLLGPVQNQEHYMNGVAARRDNFYEPILEMLEEAYQDFATLTGRKYGLISEYNCEKASTVFLCLGSSAENIEAVIKYLQEERNEEVGVIHLNCIRPFPAEAIVKAIKGKKNVIILERTEDPLANELPMIASVRAALAEALSFKNNGCPSNRTAISCSEMPLLFSGVYGLGSRDFRPEGILAAYDYSIGKTTRKDGKSAKEGECFFFVGIDHPYAVHSNETPSCLPKNAIALRMHSIGGWGMITTGKNLGEIIGVFSDYVAKRDGLTDDTGAQKEVVHVSANPKYGSEKKGAPTNYFLVAAPERIKVNCDLKHVNVVLCCDPKIFLHSNPLVGMEKGGALVWESDEPTQQASWERIPPRYRKEIVEKKIELFTLPGFKIAKEATSRPELQLRMQGNAFLGAFFKVSSFLKDYDIPQEEYTSTVKKQYEKKFGRFGEAVVASNMRVMKEGFDLVQKVDYGDIESKDRSNMSAEIIKPYLAPQKTIVKTRTKAPLFTTANYDKEFRAGLGYDQPATALSSVGMIASGTGATASKYVSRRQIPIWNEENCTQCMDCITTCPDTALPNTAQSISTILETSIKHYVNDKDSQKVLLEHVAFLDSAIRDEMKQALVDKDTSVQFRSVARKHLGKVCNENNLPGSTIQELESILDAIPLAFQKVRGIFANKEKKEEGAGGLFSIFVSDLCKGCGACVEVCGDDAIHMVDEDDELHAKYKTSELYLDLLPETKPEYLGLFNAATPQESRAATLRYHLMLQSKYKSFLSGDGACAGCGEKSILRSLVTLTETFMRPVFKAKSIRLLQKISQVKEVGLQKLQKLASSNKDSYEALKQTILHLLIGLGGTDENDTQKRIQEGFSGTDQDLINAITNVMTVDATNHEEPRYIKGELVEGMTVMAMAANTGCNSVYGSTSPTNPHPYPWMNSLFQDGPTIGWLIAEGFIQTHANRSVIPERIADALLETESVFTKDDYFTLTHFSDLYMTDIEIMELPKVWCVGGDGGMGDIGFQNLSKVVLQNRPNVKALMLNTQVYSNTGGQNSDSSVMAGGFDMNQYGPATEGKITEMKSIADCFMGGHGSPYIAEVSMANTATLYKSIIDGLAYRGTAYFQVFTTCQPEHGVGDDSAVKQSQKIRDSRGIVEFVYNPALGERTEECLSIKGNPSEKLDWYMKKIPGTKEKFAYTAAHWAFSEARFRRHHKIIQKEATTGMILLEDMLKNITMNDIVYRRFVDKNSEAFVPKDGVYTIDYNDDGAPVYHVLSRQMVLFCVERRKAWRLLQSKAGVQNDDYAKLKEGKTEKV